MRTLLAPMLAAALLASPVIAAAAPGATAGPAEARPMTPMALALRHQVAALELLASSARLDAVARRLAEHGAHLGTVAFFDSAAAVQARLSADERAVAAVDDVASSVAELPGV